jgi:GT2 family glycosyltransferase
MPRLSIIVVVQDLLPMNRLFLEHLRAATDGPYELIVVDNASTDGSGEFFAAQGATVLVNDQSYGYGHCHNRGLAVATGDIVAFLNNDLILSPHWDTRLLEIMAAQGLDVITPCTAENVEDRAATRRLMRRWKRIKNPTLFLLGAGELALRLSHRLMYGNWNRFVEARWRRFGQRVKEGFVGAAVIMTRRGLELLGAWDPRVQAADFDLFIRSKDRSLTHGDVKPCAIALGVFVHHYIRLTSRRRRRPFVDQDRFVTIDTKWGPELAARYLAHIDD